MTLLAGDEERAVRRRYAGQLPDQVCRGGGRTRRQHRGHLSQCASRQGTCLGGRGEGQV